MRALVLALCLSGMATAAPLKLYEVTFEEIPRQTDLRHLTVTFYVKPPKPEVVDQIVRQSLETAAMVDPKVEILATAFDRDDNVLEDDQWSGPLVWDIETQKVMPLKNRKKAGSK
ncbi:MAG: hypothetical protein ACKOEM_00950 [Planctomycetia bacterium]